MGSALGRASQAPAPNQGLEEEEFAREGDSVLIAMDDSSDSPPAQLALGETPPTSPLSAQLQEAVCGICFENFPWKMTHRLCSHHFCPDCMSGYVSNTLLDKVHFPVRCPEPTCDTTLTPNLVQKMAWLSTEDQLAKFARFSREAMLSDAVWCTNPSCGELLLDRLTPATPSPAGQRFICTLCSVASCVDCRSPWHPDMDCAEYQKLVEQAEFGREDENMEQLSLAMRWKRCPSCHARVELQSGCNHVRCPCSCDFCFSCGSLWPEGASACVSGCSLFRRASSVTDAVNDGWDELDPLLNGATHLLERVLHHIGRLLG